MPIETFLASTGMIFVTELGDKTMVTALCLSAQYRRPSVILLATMLALTISTTIAVVVGIVLAATLPVDIIVYISGAMFIGLGVYTLIKNDTEDDDSCDNPGTFLSIVSLILFSELGDKSQIATIALVVQSLFPIMVFAGALLGFLIVNTIATLLGNKIANNIPIETVKKIAGLVFILFGVLIIFGIL